LLDLAPDYDRIAAIWSKVELRNDRRQSIWRYYPLLPLAGASPVRLAIEARSRSAGDLVLGSALDAVGWTPLARAPRLGAVLGLPRLLIKDDGLNPTGSTKDRASAVVIARALELGESTVAVASTGNAAAATAGLCAAAGLRAVIFVPEAVPRPKVAQLLIYGATVLLVRGSYDQAYDLCLAAGARWGWYCRNTAYNPFTTEGKKTAALEIAEQLDWEVPDDVVVAVGDGNILTGLHRGFVDLRELGWTDRIPRLIGVQSTRSAAVYNAWRAGAAVVSPTTSDSVADSINAGRPRDGGRALRAMRESGGACVTVEDEAILDAVGHVARATGTFVEPAAGAAFAGLFALAANGEVGAGEQIVVLSTGTGLKDPLAALDRLAPPTTVEPTLDAVAEALGMG
jgi:threonine synthase